MSFLPVVERELRTGARRPAWYWGRVGAASRALAVAACLLLVNRRLPAPQQSQILLASLGFLALVFGLLAGVFLTADCLSEEKREGTLGLLFLTDLKGYDVVLGKLFATSAQVIYGLLAIFPMLALPLLMGGVTGAEFWRIVLAVLATLFLSLSLGLAVSAVSQEASQAMVSTFLGLLVLAGLPPALWALYQAFSRATPPTVLLFPCPPFVFYAAFGSSYRTQAGAEEFWTSLALLFLLGLGLLVAAAVILPRAWHDRRKARVTRGSLAQPEGAVGSGRLRPGAGGESELGTDPYLWLANQGQFLGTASRAVLALIGLVWLWGLLGTFGGSQHDEAFAVCVSSSYVLHGVFKCLVAVEATRRFSRDRRTGALELLLVTPLQESDILAGQDRALVRRFAGLRWLMVLVNLTLVGMALIFGRWVHLEGRERAVFMELFLGGALMLLCDFKVLCRVGMWRGLKAKSHSRAVLGTIGRVMLVPWLALLLLGFMSANIPSPPSSVAVIFAAWFAVGLVNNAVVYLRARVALSRGLRSCLT